VHAIKQLCATGEKQVIFAASVIGSLKSPQLGNAMNHHRLFQMVQQESVRESFVFLNHRSKLILAEQLRETPGLLY